MQNEFINMANDFNEKMMASAKRLGELNMRTFETMLAKQAEMFNACLESSAKQYEVMTTAKDVKEAMSAQGDLMKGCNEKFMDNLRETAEMMNSVRDELSSVVEEAVKYTSDSVEKASELATKKAA